MELYTIDSGNLMLDGGAMFGVVPKSLWSKKYPSDENNMCNWAMRCLLFVDGNRKVLIDTGIGNKQDEKFRSHFFLNGNGGIVEGLAAKGFAPEEITDVVLTHLHFDHAGGAISRTESGELVPTFPNATYYVGKAHWEWAVNPNLREKASFLTENIMPLQQSGKLVLVEEECEIIPNVRVEFYNGHTDGQMIPHINYKDRTVVFPADLLPSAAHIPMPWVMSYDTKPLQTLSDKERFFKKAVEGEYVIVFEHDLYRECAILENTPKGIKERETFLLEDFKKLV
ncbi:MAG TPA: MBL fold metallo-hydrolase [Bacteroidales bacterium]|nr:MBL fold metallo-hydrolase [Bacteroidales bacterium]